MPGWADRRRGDVRAGALSAGAAVLLLAGALAAPAAAPAVGPLLAALRLIPTTAAPPPLSLPRVEDGRTVTLGELRGRVVLLYFWATW